MSTAVPGTTFADVEAEEWDEEEDGEWDEEEDGEEGVAVEGEGGAAGSAACVVDDVPVDGW
ncbi:hypothetical protein ABT072_00445 [Streptomyces sp. NPDC002589]|uniref:hypothetical protein n=1 Tax=Streptomyces sp. NPDC002589 TaxID=3154420 RepID=UPI00332F4548